MSELCIFYGIVQREVPADVVIKGEPLIVILTLEHHPLVVRKQPISIIISLDER
jgi:hypothetical protein